MSLLGNIAGAVLPGIGAALGGPIGGLIGSIGGSMFSEEVPAPSAPGGGGGTVVNVMGSLPSLPAIGAGAMAVGSAAVAGGRFVMSSAIAYCRKHPVWCANIGGTAVVAGMVADGRLPKIKRKRARGISPSEFRGFNKVHKVLSRFCAPRMKIRRKARSC